MQVPTETRLLNCTSLSMQRLQGHRIIGDHCCVKYRKIFDSLNVYNQAKQIIVYNLKYYVYSFSPLDKGQDSRSLVAKTNLKIKLNIRKAVVTVCHNSNPRL